MLVNKTKAAALAGVSRRTFYNHIKTKSISLTTDAEGDEKVDISELKRIYGQEKILKNLQTAEEGAKDELKENAQGKSVQSTRDNTAIHASQSVSILEEQLKSASALIYQLKQERENLIEDKRRMQEQLDRALEIGAPIGKLLTDQREDKELRANEKQTLEDLVKTMQAQNDRFLSLEEERRRRMEERRKKLEEQRDKQMESKTKREKSRGLMARLFG